jgi:hypothetical protein
MMRRLHRSGGRSPRPGGQWPARTGAGERRRRSLAPWGVLACLTVIGVMGCRPTAEQTVTHGDRAPTDQVSFIDSLRGSGHTVEILGDVEQPFLQAQGTRVQASGGSLAAPAELQLFQYESPAAARSDVGRLDRQGNPPGTRINWIAPPHFFQSGRLVALYVGNDTTVVQTLSRLLGPAVVGSEGS